VSVGWTPSGWRMGVPASQAIVYLEGIGYCTKIECLWNIKSCYFCHPCMTLTPSKYIRGLTLLLSTWAEIYLSCSPVYEVLNTYVHLMTKGLDKKRFITCFTDENERERERERKYGFIFHNPKSTRVNCQFKIKDHHKKNLFYRLKCSCSFFSITDTYERKNKNYYASF